MNLSLFLFKNRSYTPVPLIILALIFADPSLWSVLGGLAVMLIGETIRFRGVAFAGSATRTTSQAGGAELITSGPFAYVRNPLYVGNFFLALGFVIMAWALMPYMVALLIILFAVQYSLIVKHEEAYLLETFQDEYKVYTLNVRRWLPRLSPFIGHTKHEPNVKGAFRSERNTFQSILIVTVIIILRWLLF